MLQTSRSTCRSCFLLRGFLVAAQILVGIWILRKLLCTECWQRGRACPPSSQHLSLQERSLGRSCSLERGTVCSIAAERRIPQRTDFLLPSLQLQSLRTEDHWQLPSTAGDCMRPILMSISIAPIRTHQPYSTRDPIPHGPRL